jgi:hypothetical protein
MNEKFLGLYFTLFFFHEQTLTPSTDIDNLTGRFLTDLVLNSN